MIQNNIIRLNWKLNIVLRFWIVKLSRSSIFEGLKTYWREKKFKIWGYKDLLEMFLEIKNVFTHNSRESQDRSYKTKDKEEKRYRISLSHKCVRKYRSLSQCCLCLMFLLTTCLLYIMSQCYQLHLFDIN